MKKLKRKNYNNDNNYHGELCTVIIAHVQSDYYALLFIAASPSITYGQAYLRIKEFGLGCSFWFYFCAHISRYISNFTIILHGN